MSDLAKDLKFLRNLKTDQPKPGQKTAHAIEVTLDYLFSNWNGDKAHRLVLTSSDGRDLGGWGRAAVREQLQKLLSRIPR